MESIFTKIINKQIPAFIIYEDTDLIAFLDAFPLCKGHTLVLPKKQIDKLFDLDKPTYEKLMAICYAIAQAIEKTIPCLRVGMSVVGLEIPHAHVHLVPINTLDDLNFTRPKQKFTKEEFTAIALEIKNNLT